MKDKAQLTSEAKFILREAGELRFTERQHQRDSVVGDLIVSFVQAYPGSVPLTEMTWERREELASLLAKDDPLWRSVEDLLADGDAALTRYPDDGKTVTRWRHQAVQNLELKKDFDDSAPMDSLANCAGNYCKSIWAESHSLELWLVRQMAYAEAFAFARETGIPLQPKSAKFMWMWFKSLVKWAIGLFVAIGVGDAHGLPLGVLTYVVWLALTKYLAKEQLEDLVKRTEVFLALKNVYVLAMRSNPSPVEIERALLNAEAKGAVWPEGMRSVVEKALQRDRVLWRAA